MATIQGGGGGGRVPSTLKKLKENISNKIKNLQFDWVF